MGSYIESWVLDFNFLISNCNFCSFVGIDGFVFVDNGIVDLCQFFMFMFFDFDSVFVFCFEVDVGCWCSDNKFDIVVMSQDSQLIGINFVGSIFVVDNVVSVDNDGVNVYVFMVEVEESISYVVGDQGGGDVFEDEFEGSKMIVLVVRMSFGVVGVFEEIFGVKSVDDVKGSVVV